MRSVPSKSGGGGHGQLTVSQSTNLPSAQLGRAPTIEHVEPAPIRLHQLTEEKLSMLATLPRKKWDEFTYAALTGFIAALPSAIEAVYNAAQRSEFSVHAFELVQVLIAAGFFVWFMVKVYGGSSEQTAAELLKELCGKEDA